MTDFPYKIRPISPETDAAEIARLIRTSFLPWLDLENLDYLDHLRSEGLYSLRHPFLTKFSGFPYKLDGVVCVDTENKVIGVINTYYFFLNGTRCCLIANVCVDPSHRKEGIATKMLQETERLQIADGIRDIYLQARLAVPQTVTFYRERGFRVTDYRETWIHPLHKKGEEPVNTNYRLERVPETDVPIFTRQMSIYYPSTILWNLNYRAELFKTGFLAEVGNLLRSGVNRFRRLTDRSGRVLAWAAWQKTEGSSDRLWAVPNENLPPEAYSQALMCFVRAYQGNKALKLDAPAASAAEVYKQAGFSLMQTLAWMWKRL